MLFEFTSICFTSFSAFITRFYTEGLTAGSFLRMTLPSITFIVAISSTSISTSSSPLTTSSFTSVSSISIYPLPFS